MNFIKFILLFIFSSCFTTAFCQIICISGDCNNGSGIGSYIVGDREIGVFEGKFKDTKFEKGKFTFSNGDSYDGEWNEYFIQGYGVRTMENGTELAGRWHRGRLVDTIEASAIFAKLENKNIDIITISCELGDCKNGVGKSVDSKENRYSGEFKNAIYNGYGEMHYSNGDHFKGFWKEGNFNGKGSYFQANGDTRTGDWVSGKFSENPTEIFALVVGIADYQDFEKLSYTTSDAMEFYKQLRSPSGGLLPKENVMLLIDQDATALNIQNKMADLFTMADTNDLVILYFAGHGIDGAFLAVDYDGYTNYVDHVSIINAMKDSDAKYKLIIADACHSGSLNVKYEEFRKNGNQFPLASVRSGKSVSEQAKEFYRSFGSTKKGLAIITSSAPDEISLEANKLKQGVFSYFLIEGLKGAADADKNYVINAKELFDYVSTKVDKFTYGFQTPNFIGFTDGDDIFSDIPVGVYYPKEEENQDK